MAGGRTEKGTLSIGAGAGWLGPGRRANDFKVVCDGDLISWTGPAADAPAAERAVELEGFLMPAVADRHAHIALGEPGAVLVSGITAVRDMGWSPREILSLAEASEGPSFNGPLIRAAGAMITAPGGYPTRASWAPAETGFPVRTSAEATAAVQDMAARGAAHIALVLDSESGPALSDAAVAAACQAAHELGLQVAGRASGSGEAERALGAGVDELSRVPWTEVVPDRVISAMAKAMRWVSVLGPLVIGGANEGLRVAMENASRFVSAGGTLAYGTDLGRTGGPGTSVEELTLMEAAGMTSDSLLEALVRAPLTPGAPADLIGLAADPFEDLSTLASPILVVRAGRVVVPAG